MAQYAAVSESELTPLPPQLDSESEPDFECGKENRLDKWAGPDAREPSPAPRARANLRHLSPSRAGLSMAVPLPAAAMVDVNCRCSRVVFVGNIAFHASEDELRDACELIGPVRSLCLAADPATNKRKGYAFVEYADDETARSACRNLHGHLLRGRELRVGLTGRPSSRRRGGGDREPVGMEDAVHAASLVVSGRPLASVTRYLAARSRQEVREMVAALESTEQLKQKVPGLGTAMEQAQRLLEMFAADEEEVARKKLKRASDSLPGGADEQHAKLSKVVGVDGGVKASRIVPCF